MSASDYVIETQRIGLRPFVREDAEALLQIFADPEAQRFYPYMNGMEMANRWIAKNLGRYQSDGFGLWALCLKPSSELIGDCGLTLQAVEDGREVEVGYHLRADQRGRGLAFEAAKACLDWGFAQLDCSQLVSIVHPDNTASARLAGRLHARSRWFWREELRCRLFYTQREDWRRSSDESADS